jgi:hypothetical protein
MYGVWKEVTIVTIEMGARSGGFRKGEARRKLGNSNVLVAQNTSMIKKEFCKIGIGLITLSFGNSCSS